MRYHYTFLDSVEREGDVGLTSDTLHTQAELDAACKEAYRLALEHNLANPEAGEDGEVFDDPAYATPDDSQVLHYLTTAVLPDLVYVGNDGYLSTPSDA